MSFDSHPDALVSGVPVPLINSMDDRAALMRRLYGIDDVIFAHFDRAMMEMPWEDFLGDFLVRQHGAAHLVCGHDFRFGYRGQGTPERLREYCAAHGLGCDVIPEVLLDGRTVSSTTFGRSLLRGKWRRPSGISATRTCCLAWCGTDLAAARRSRCRRQISRFRRACLFRRSASTRRRPRWRAGAGRRASTSACHPTAGALERPVLEAWLQADCGDLYGKEIVVFLYKMVRAERKFASMEALKTQVLHDTEEILNYLKERNV